MKKFILSIYSEIDPIYNSKTQLTCRSQIIVDVFPDEEIDEILNFLWLNKIFDY